jgi:hypothetical protein
MIFEVVLNINDVLKTYRILGSETYPDFSLIVKFCEFVLVWIGCDAAVKLWYDLEVKGDISRFFNLEVNLLVPFIFYLKQ